MLESNKLNGTIPTELGFLTKLKNLLMFKNELTGSVPSELGLLTALGTYFLQFKRCDYFFGIFG